MCKALLCGCIIADSEGGGDGEELNRKRKHEISPIKWTSADTEAVASSKDCSVVVVVL